MRSILLPFCLSLAAVVEPAAAQTIHRMDAAKSFPLVERDEGGYAGCGIRVVGADTDGNVFYDFSLRLAWKYPHGLLDARTIKVPRKKVKEGEAAGTLVKPTPARFWIVKETDAKALRPEQIGKDNVPGVLLASLPLMPTSKAIVDIMQGERMHFAIGYPSSNKDSDRTLSFKAPLSQEDSTALAACLIAMFDSMEEEAKQAKSGKQN